MRIQHNIMAMNAYRNYTTNTSALSKNLEKLSSGYKINRAGDDAAGLAISEKMRAQITGLETAQKNAKDGISLVQTAEGALTEVHDMLNRMYELAEQSANGTYDDETDRANLQKELDALRTEINRISQSANFNGIKLFTKGDDAATVSELTATVDNTNAAKLGNVSFAFDAGATDEVKKAFAEAVGDSASITVTTTDEGDTNWGAGDTISVNGLPAGYTLTFADQAGKDAALTQNQPITVGTGDGKLDASADLVISIADADGNKVGTLTIAKPTGGADGASTVTLAPKAETDTADAPTFKDAGNLSDFDVDSLDFTNFKGTITEDADVKLAYDGVSKKLTATIGSETYELVLTDNANDLNGKTIELANTGDPQDKIGLKMAATVTKVGADKNSGGDDISQASIGTLSAPKTTDDTTAAGGGSSEFSLQIGDDGESYNQLKFSIGGISTTDLKIDNISVADQKSAQDALKNIRDAINQVSGIRGELGAIQNRLDHTINNLSVMQENIQDAESTIRDTDVADEMMAYTKNNILVQSAQAMLAQANQIPQGVLQLLQ